jgi:hypothetical protein
MSKVTLSLRVRPKLLAQFTDAALKAHRLPSEVLVEFIGNYVRDVRERKLLVLGEFASTLGEISEGNVVDFARASERLLCQRATKEGENLARRFINGEIGPPNSI